MSTRLQKAFLIPSLLCLLLAIGILLYKGSGWVVLRNSGGDVVAVAFLYFTISLFWKAPAVYRIGTVALIALLIELAQLLNLTPQHQTLVTEIALGSSFDPWDLLAYGIGLAIALRVKRSPLALPQRRADRFHN